MDSEELLRRFYERRLVRQRGPDRRYSRDYFRALRDFLVKRRGFGAKRVERWMYGEPDRGL